MIEVVGDLWEFPGVDARVVTTNGYVTQTGECVMGRGCAMEARNRWPGINVRLGKRITESGNHAYAFSLADWDETRFLLVTFPVKPVVGSDGSPGFSCPAELPIIERSAHRLVKMADHFGWRSVVLPRPGAGNGGLDYADVREVIAPILDGRFAVITFP